MEIKKSTIKKAIDKAIQSFAERKDYAMGAIVSSPSKDIKIVSTYMPKKCEQTIYVCGGNVVTIGLIGVSKCSFSVTYDMSNSTLPSDFVTSEDMFDFISDALKSVGYSYDEIYLVRKFTEEDGKKAINLYYLDNCDDDYDGDLVERCLDMLVKKLIGTNIPLEYKDDGITDPFGFFCKDVFEYEMSLLLEDENKRNELEEFLKKMDSK